MDCDAGTTQASDPPIGAWEVEWPYYIGLMWDDKPRISVSTLTSHGTQCTYGEEQKALWRWLFRTNKVMYVRVERGSEIQLLHVTW